MRQQQKILCVLLIFILGYQTQAQTTTPVPPEWNGDPRVCVTKPAPTPSPEPSPGLPKFPNKAEFALERIEIKHLFNITFPSEMTMMEHIYDYDNNQLIIVRNKNGFIDTEYFYYNILKKSTYYGRQYCVVSDIPQDIDMDGTSATKYPTGTPHIRPMNEYLLFSSVNPSQPVMPIYLGKDTIRGIPVDKWQSCYIDKANYRTVRRQWAFAQRGVTTAAGLVGEYAVPVQAIISASFDFPNGTQAAEVDEVYNVLSYRPYIMETAEALAPPKGVFCSSGPGQQLISLQDAHIRWPNRFSVRVEASTSRAPRYQRFHLRYDSGRDFDGTARRIRYDYMPPGAEDFHSVIHDYSTDLTYNIDRRLGSCKITRGVTIPDVNPIIDPIEFFIKNEAMFLYNPPANAWEYNGVRACRGNTIKCVILTTSMDNFPAMIDVDTGKPSGEMWSATNIEYAWSMRAPYARPSGRPPFNGTKEFDYPVSLFLKMYRLQNPGDMSPGNIRTEDIEYEFFEMSHERNPYDFDVSICYRSLNYEYLHLVFTLKVNRGNIIDGNQLDRRELEGYVRYVLTNRTETKFSRITDLEIDHERASNDVSVFFTLLGRTPNPDSPSGFVDEITAAQARDKLQQSINNGQFLFDFRVGNDSTVEFRAEPNSLISSKQYMSTHAVGRSVLDESYSSGAQAVAVIFGLLVGVIIGAILAAVFRIVRKEPMPNLPTSLSNPLPNINFRANKSDNKVPATSTA